MTVAARILATLVALAILAGAGWLANGWRLDLAQAEQERDQNKAALVALAEAVEQQQRTNDAHLQASRRVGARLADDLERLRQRPERLPASDAQACAGAGGAELSGPDAAFLVREAARADQIRAGLEACYKQYDAIK